MRRKDESDAPLNALAVRARNRGAPSVMMTGPSIASLGDIKQDSISPLHVTNVYFMLIQVLMLIEFFHPTLAYARV
ncbi:hypothetical protein B1812_04290 [Methylocystis bryophila]|uniref:Uncharacterized protein n=1 Tax=Methylocystis bryophila TaxID=655015 RepID=A0A1W6MS33_9HYPH|nr:hypothetical protein B1812_04290 [Methylocystis bryophila]